jgi:hypothetical protein
MYEPLRVLSRKIELLINFILSFCGLKVIKKRKWRLKSRYEILNCSLPILRVVRRNTMIPEPRLVNIKECIDFVLSQKIEGAYVECGVWKGGSVAFAASCYNSWGVSTPLHLFDVFDDICEPDASVDGDRAIQEAGGIKNAQGRLRSVKGMYDSKGGPGSESEVIKLITSPPISYKREFVNIHKGWFQETLPISLDEVKKIAILRLDGDWYSSTKVCLEYLYPLVEKDGIIIVDDYGCYEGCRRAVDEYLISVNFKPFLFKVDDYCVFFQKK